MKRQFQEYSREVEYLQDQLDPNEIIVLGYLKGFDRKSMKEWQKKGLYD